MRRRRARGSVLICSGASAIRRMSSRVVVGHQGWAVGGHGDLGAGHAGRVGPVGLAQAGQGLPEGGDACGADREPDPLPVRGHRQVHREIPAIRAKLRQRRGERTELLRPHSRFNDLTHRTVTTTVQARATIGGGPRVDAGKDPSGTARSAV
ncbi:MAG: hypothetical protein ACRDTT_03895 [Pseudonocardiaceae bacterium]